MSILRRIKRVIKDERFIPMDGREEHGRAGEAKVQRDLAARYRHVYTNRVVPHPKKEGGTLEADALVYEGGILFCLEIKSFLGRVTFDSDGKRLRKERLDRVDHYKDPLNQAMYFLEQLPRLHPSLSGIPRVPVAVFNDDPELDISAIRSLERGYILASDLPAFIDARIKATPPRSQKKAPPAPEPLASTPPRPWWEGLRYAMLSLMTALFGWPPAGPAPAALDVPPAPAALSARAKEWQASPRVLHALDNLPASDRLVMANGDEFHGVLGDEHLTLLDEKKRPVEIPLGSIGQVTIERKARWSAGDIVRVTAPDGTERTYWNLDGDVRLRTGDGKVVTYALRGVHRVHVASAGLSRPPSEASRSSARAS